MTGSTLAVVVWLAGIVPAAFVLYPLARWDDMAEAAFTAVMFAVLWPVIVVTAAVLLPLWVLGWLVRKVYE